MNTVKAKHSKQFWSPSEVAELTAAAVAALPSPLSPGANITINASGSAKKANPNMIVHPGAPSSSSTISTHRNENGDIVHHHQSMHLGNNAALLTSTTTTIHHHISSADEAMIGTNGMPVNQGFIHPHQLQIHNHIHRHASIFTEASQQAHQLNFASNKVDLQALTSLHGKDIANEILASSSFQGDLNKIDIGLNSEDADLQLEAAKKLRILLSSERDLLIRQVSSHNINANGRMVTMLC